MKIIAALFLMLLAFPALAAQTGGPGSISLAGDYVPYTGATKAIDIGAQNLTTTGTLSGGYVTDGTAQMTGGVITGVSSLTASNIGAYTLAGKLTAGAIEIEGSDFDIDGGNVSSLEIAADLLYTTGQDFDGQTLTGVASLSVSNISAYALAGKLTAGVVEIEGSNFDINGGNVSSLEIAADLQYDAAQNLDGQNLTTSGQISGGTVTDGTLSISSGNITSAVSISATGNLTLDNTGSSVNSPWLTLLGDNGGTEIEGGIFLAYGANPYLRFSVDDDSASPALTAVMDLSDNALTFATDNVTDIGASGASRPKDIFAAGNLNIAGTSETSGLVLTGSATVSVTDGGGVTPEAANLLIVGAGGAVDITANPQIAAGSAGQILELTGQSDTNTVKLDDGTGLVLAGGQSFTLGLHDVIGFRYDVYSSSWIERYRSNN